MRCYEYSLYSNTITRNWFHVEPHGPNQYSVSLVGRTMCQPEGPAQKIRLSAELEAEVCDMTASKHISPGGLYLHRCDVEKRSEIWLKPETPATVNHALVLCTAIQRRTFICRMRPIIEVSGSGSEELARAATTFPNPAYKGWTILAKLLPGGKITIAVPNYSTIARSRRKITAELELMPDGSLRQN